MKFLLIQIAIRFCVSIGFGLAALKIYDLFVQAFQEKSRFKIWLAFTSSVFLFVMILFLFVSQ